MNKPHDTAILEAARRYAEAGLPIIPLDGKVPAVKGWQVWVANEVGLALWFGTRGANVGLRTGESGYIVVDTDTPEAEQWVLAHLPESPMRARSGAGSTHRYYERPPKKEVRNRQGWKGIHGLDIRGQGGFIVLPPSIHPETDRPYEWLTELLPHGALPRFSPGWIRQRTRRRATQVIEACGDMDFMEYRASRWLERVASESPAVSGQGGHNATFRVACKMTHLPEDGFGLDRETAIRLIMAIYNPLCRPPWELKDIEHKVDDALKKRR